MTTNFVDPVDFNVTAQPPAPLPPGALIASGNNGSVVVNKNRSQCNSGDNIDVTSTARTKLQNDRYNSPAISPSPLPVSYSADYSCGLCSFRPKSLQSCANEKTFLAIFCLTSVLQGMFYTYFVSVLTTIEKLYQIQSKTTGFIMSATEMGQISGVLFLTYYGGKGNRPKWIGCGMIVFALAALFSASPHYFFDSQARARFSPQPDFISSSSSSSSLSPSSSLNDLSNSEVPKVGLLMMRSQLCSTFKVDLPSNSLSNSGSRESHCASEESTKSSNRLTNSVLVIFFISLLLIGIGSTTTNNLGICYIDDNVAPKESPLYFGITIGVKIFGPVIGFLLGSVCTNIHVDFPFGESTISNPSDPQWIGAWWLGMIFVFLSLSVASICMLSFPRSLPKPNPNSFSHSQSFENDQLQVTFNNHNNEELLLTTRDDDHDHDHDHDHDQDGKEQKIGNSTVAHSKSPVSDETAISAVPSSEAVQHNLRDFPSTMCRLLKNEILLLRTASSVLHILPIAGIYTFLPKYLESQFQLTASQASAVAGIAGILVMGVGIFSSSFFMRKYKPEPKFVALWIAMAALIYSIGMVILMGLGCETNKFVGSNVNSDYSNNLKSCQQNCSCSGHFSPICTSQKDTYLSPCIAGCTKVDLNSSSYMYSECNCLGANVTATNGFCPLECSNLTWYIVVFAIIVLVHSTGEVGSMLLTLRCVEPQDKAMALGVVSFSIGLFGNVPCPILYGTVVDSACLFWEESCGKLGACRIYDSYKFRTTFHGLTAFIMFIAFLVDFVVWYRASSIKFNDEDATLDGNGKSLALKPQQKPLDGSNKKLNRPAEDNDDGDEEEEEDDNVIISSTVTRSSELKPLNVIKLNESNAEDIV